MAIYGREGAYSKKCKKKPWTKNDSQLLVLAAPATLWYLVFSYLPMFGVIIAFKDYRVLGSFLRSVVVSPWAGIKNFYFLFSNSLMWLVIRNTLLYNTAIIILGIFVPVALAIIISEIWNKRLAKLYQTIIFFPYFLSWVVVSALVMAFLSYEAGITNRFIEALGGEKVFWYRNTSFWPPFLVFMSQWKGMGYGMVLYLASITSQDKEIYEAAIIDGATKWQQIRRITLPLLKPVIILLFILSTGRIFYSDFGLFYQVPRNTSALFDVVYTIDVFVYQQLKSATTGMAAAAALLQSAVSCVMILAVNQIIRKIDPDSAMI
ncbi:MAG: ABC transporter permease subunit [Treponema sp.]|jgi:putative aldouronate transport system permease protein|nr:ABC transporter permease subunit [Treponema sp.]